MYAFVHISKTAGTTLTSILRRSFGIRHFDDRILQRPMLAKDLRQLKKIMPFVSSLAGHGIQPHLDLHEADPELRYYTFLREPIARSVSCFQFVVATNPRYRNRSFTSANLREWFFRHTERDNNCQTRHLAGSQEARLAIATIEEQIEFVGLVHSFDESLHLLRTWMNGCLDIRYQPLNVSAKREAKRRVESARMQTLRAFCKAARQDPDMLQFLQAHNEADQELYQYVSEHVYPRQQSELLQKMASDVIPITQPVAGRAFGIESRLRMLPAKLQRNLVIKPLKKWLFDAA